MHKRTKRIAIGSSLLVAVAIVGGYAVAGAAENSAEGDDPIVAAISHDTPDTVDEPGPAGGGMINDPDEDDDQGMSINAARKIPSKPCTKAGPTANDGKLAKELTPKVHGTRLKKLNAGQVECARAIIKTIKDRKLESRAATIAVTTAITETTLHNYTKAVDHDSLGLFQQRPSTGWGKPSQLIDPVYATNAFTKAMLRKFPHNAWQHGEIGKICQKVQVSAVPGAYQHEVQPAQLLVDALWRNV